jgi:hypothetical protein
VTGGEVKTSPPISRSSEKPHLLEMKTPKSRTERSNDLQWNAYLLWSPQTWQLLPRAQPASHPARASTLITWSQREGETKAEEVG